MSYRLIVLLCSLALSSAGQCAVVEFNGKLDIIALDNGTGIFSNTPLGTAFSGFIDDTIFSGELSGGGVTSVFSCCIAAGGLGVSNDVVLDSDDAAFLNAISMTTRFSAGDMVDIIDLEADHSNPSGSRTEVGLSYVFDGATFADNSTDNYPFDANGVIAALFFILEVDAVDNEIYSAFGKLNPVPLPLPIMLLSFSLSILFGAEHRRFRKLARSAR